MISVNEDPLGVCKGGERECVKGERERMREREGKRKDEKPRLEGGNCGN